MKNGCKEVRLMFKLADLFLVDPVGLICTDIRTCSTFRVSVVFTNRFHRFVFFLANAILQKFLTHNLTAGCNGTTLFLQS